MKTDFILHLSWSFALYSRLPRLRVKAFLPLGSVRYGWSSTLSQSAVT
ncbi:MAG TPA: hypothetical protein PKM57_10040 [Kiritimatiellia bacterium]|nr:hypothetical protein [Kiritimatiellia bacterium]